MGGTGSTRVVTWICEVKLLTRGVGNQLEFTPSVSAQISQNGSSPSRNGHAYSHENGPQARVEPVPHADSVRSLSSGTVVFQYTETTRLECGILACEERGISRFKLDSVIYILPNLDKGSSVRLHSVDAFFHPSDCKIGVYGESQVGTPI